MGGRADRVPIKCRNTCSDGMEGEGDGRRALYVEGVVFKGLLTSRVQKNGVVSLKLQTNAKKCCLRSL